MKKLKSYLALVDHKYFELEFSDGVSGSYQTTGLMICKYCGKIRGKLHFYFEDSLIRCKK